MNVEENKNVLREEQSMKKWVVTLLSSVLILIGLTNFVIAGSAVGEAGGEEPRIILLERALEPQEPYIAAQLWAEGVKTRNGALQYAVMSTQLKPKYYGGFADLGWVTGVSSPWIESYEVTERYRRDHDIYRYEVTFNYTDSTKSHYSTKNYIVVEHIDSGWFISAIEEVEIELIYEHIELEDITSATDLSLLERLETRQFINLDDENLVLNLYSGNYNAVSGVFKHGDNEFILPNLGYAHDTGSIKLYDLQISYQFDDRIVWLPAAIGSHISGYKYVFYNEHDEQWLFYHNGGIPICTYINNDGVSEILIQFDGLHNNAPNGFILSFSQGQFKVANINSALKTNFELSNDTTVSSTFRQQDEDILVDIELYGDKRMCESYYFVDDSMVFLKREPSSSTVYENSQYGFSFVLPESWSNFAVVIDKWEGLSIGGDEIIATGAIINLRHPLWTTQNPRQDIPIMVLTLDQWELLMNHEFHVGAAPIGPRKIGQNSEYVFAIPARYNYAFPPGFEEVDQILDNCPLNPFACSK